MNTVCKIDGCDARAVGYGWCKKHYTRWLRHGDPNKTLKAENVADAFARYTTRDGECVVWTGYMDHAGYGRVRFNGRMENAHRVAWTLQNGPIADGLVIDHICFRHACVNPAHLRLATARQNNRNRNGASPNNKTTRVRGVYPHGRGYAAAIGLNNKRIYLGTFDTIDEARAAVDRARTNMYGNFAGRSISLLAPRDRATDEYRDYLMERDL